MKLDGYRAEAIKDSDGLRLLSSRGNDFTSDFPEIPKAVSTINAKSALIDGEIVAVDASGKHSFQALQSRLASQAGYQTVFYAFDLLYLDGKSLINVPIEDRKRKLEKIIQGSQVLLCPELVGDPELIESNVRAFGLEGIVAKRRGSKYESGDRSGTWRKYKTSPAQEFVIAGYRPEGPKVEALLVGFYEGKQLKFAGKVRAGFTPRNRRLLAEQLQGLITTKCPFSELNIVKSSRWSGGLTEEDLAVVKWVKPKLVAQISFVEWTAGGLLRHPRFLGLRSDKKSVDVVKESKQ